jgi:outer membrane protein assembly factor BamB
VSGRLAPTTRGIGFGVALVLLGALQLTPTARAVGITPSLKPAGQWSMFMNGPMRRGRSPLVGPTSAHLAWQISTQTNGGGPVIGRDGTIYQGTDLHQLLAMSPTGALKWSIPTTRAVGSTPAILPDGRIVFVDEGGTVYVANPDGTLSWTNPTGAGSASVGASPAIGVDGTIYTVIGPTVFAFHPDGTIRWTYQIIGGTLGPVAVRPDGVVYVPAGYLYAIDANGLLLWRTQEQLQFLASATVGPDRTIYVNSNLPTVYAFHPNGTIKMELSGRNLLHRGRRGRRRPRHRWHHLCGREPGQPGSDAGSESRRNFEMASESRTRADITCGRWRWDDLLQRRVRCRERVCDQAGWQPHVAIRHF